MATSYNTYIYLVCENCGHGRRDQWTMPWRKWELTLIKQCPHCNHIDTGSMELKDKKKSKKMISIKAIDY